MIGRAQGVMHAKPPRRRLTVQQRANEIRRHQQLIVELLFRRQDIATSITNHRIALRRLEKGASHSKNVP